METITVTSAAKGREPSLRYSRCYERQSSLKQDLLPKPRMLLRLNPRSRNSVLLVSLGAGKRDDPPWEKYLPCTY